MNFSNQLKTLASAVALLAGSQAAHAITPWQANDANASNYGTPDYVIYTSGGAAQDLAYQQVVLDALSKPGTVDIFQDISATSTSNGSRFTSFYFIGSSTLSDPALQGKKILLEKRSLGAAGYGVVPILAHLPLDHLDIFHTATSKLQSTWTNTTQSLVVNGVSGTSVPFHATSITTANASTFLTSTQSHGGFAGVDTAALLATGTTNYPDPVKEVSTGATTAGWTYALTPDNLSAVTRISTGGLVYGIGVTLDFYKVLQAAQIATGDLPATVTVGAYDQASLPSISRNFLASILSGNITDWSNVKLNVGGTTKSLTDASIRTAAGVSAPTSSKVAVGLRNTGAAIGAVAYAKILNYPYVDQAATPAALVPNTSAAESSAAPLVKGPTGASATQDLLLDWQGGTNNSGLNNVSGAKYWGIAVNSADRNNTVTTAGTGGKNWRYIKIDGYAPTIENVAAGNYPYWAEGEIIVDPSVGTSHEQSLFTDFGNHLGSVAVASVVNAAVIQPWGSTGIFATTATDSGAIDVPYVTTHPIVGLTHLGSDGYTHLGIVPYAYDNGNGNTIELQ